MAFYEIFMRAAGIPTSQIELEFVAKVVHGYPQLE
jgi:hypothetical protein